MGSNTSDSSSIVQEQIKEHPVVMYSTTYCGYCVKAMQLFQIVRVNPFVVYIDKESNGEEIAMALYKMTGQSTVPSIFIGGKHIGGFTQLAMGLKSGSIQKEFQRLDIFFEDFAF
jgi:glutaredoxin 3